MKSSIWIVVIGILWFGFGSYILVFQTKRVMNLKAEKWKNHSATFYKFFGFIFLLVTIGLIWIFFQRLND